MDTITLDVTDLERPETVILCALHATLQGVDAKLSRVRVRLIPVASEHVCRVRAWSIRGDVVVVEAQASTSRAAIEAAAKGLREELSKRASAFQVPRSETSSRRRAKNEPRSSAHGGATLADPTPPPCMRASRGPGRLLLALRGAEAPTASPDWAAVLARELRVELHVLRVLEVPTVHGLVPRCNWVDVTGDVQRVLTATRETRAWCDEVLPDAVFADHVCIRLGEFAEEVAIRAKEIEPELIILSAGEQSHGNMVTGLARTARRAVLVARRQNTKCMLLAATDLKDDNFPVLRKAGELSNQLHASVMAFHNVERSWAGPEPGAASGAWRRLWAAIQKERLELAADRLLEDGEVFVSHHDDLVAAIVTRARDANADTIVVGTKVQSWLDRLAKRSVAAEVVEQTDRSVLVVPLG